MDDNTLKQPTISLGPQFSEEENPFPSLFKIYSKEIREFLSPDQDQFMQFTEWLTQTVENLDVHPSIKVALALEVALLRHFPECISERKEMVEKYGARGYNEWAQKYELPFEACERGTDDTDKPVERKKIDTIEVEGSIINIFFCVKPIYLVKLDPYRTKNFDVFLNKIKKTGFEYEIKFYSPNSESNQDSGERLKKVVAKLKEKIESLKKENDQKNKNLLGGPKHIRQAEWFVLFQYKRKSWDKLAKWQIAREQDEVCENDDKIDQEQDEVREDGEEVDKEQNKLHEDVKKAVQQRRYKDKIRSRVKDFAKLVGAELRTK